LGRYALYDKIASGGMATLYFGRAIGPSVSGRTVAVKCLHPQFAQDPDFFAMFLDEARLASRIQSPFVVPTLDVVSEESELAIVMEYIHGESLGTLLQPLLEADGDSPRPAVAVTVSVLTNVLHGLQAAHEARSENGSPLGIVHRDVSPQNILVGTDGLAHVIDFGVAKAAGRLHTTREGQLKGKLAYMAPEQLRGEPVTRRSDVYAASVVLWEALVGRRLFPGADEGAIVTRVLMGEVPRPSKAASEGRDLAEVRAIERLDAVVMRGLDRDPTQRFETALEMAAALEGCISPASAAVVARWLEEAAGPALAQRAAALAAIERGPTTSTSQRRRTWMVWGAGFVVASAAITLALVPWRSFGAVRSIAGTQPAIASTPPPPIRSETPEQSEVPPASPSDPRDRAQPGAGGRVETSVTQPSKRAPAPSHSSDCNPPFTWDSQGKKHYKRNCL
jgi:serine/threonine-protein kinase